MKALEGLFLSHWNNPPEPLNPEYNPDGLTMQQAALIMDAEGYYDTHTREECAARINQLVKAGA